MRLRLIPLPAALLLTLSFLVPAAARADSVLYTFSGTVGATGTQFTYLSTSGFLGFGDQKYIPTTTSDLFVDSTEFGQITAFQFSASDKVVLYATGFGGIQFNTLDQFGLQLPVSSGESSDGFTLDIERVGASTAVTPEPSSIALLGTGVLGVAGALRKRLYKSGCPARNQIPR